jgi:hypothetical protein
MVSDKKHTDFTFSFSHAATPLLIMFSWCKRFRENRKIGQCFFNFPGCHFFFYVKSTTISRRLLGPVNRNIVEPTAVPTDNDNMPACEKKKCIHDKQIMVKHVRAMLLLM